jgi:predicted deacylase
MDSRETSRRPGGGLSISGIRVAAGETREIYLKVSESYLSGSIQIPVTVIRGKAPGPTAFITGAVHGDEINGVDIVRRLIFDVDHHKLSGTLIAIPVVNIPGFLSQSRYLPYHRDLNRFFPGQRRGNNAQRIAARIFSEVVMKCDFGIDLHTAADGRSNLPHVRGDMSHPKVRELARAFGSTVLMHQPGVRGSLRREATEAGVPTILFEAGETRKFSTKVSMAGLRGVLNVLSSVGMWPEHERAKPPFQVIVKASDWIRAEKGGILDLEVKPGELVYEDDLIGTILNPFGRAVTKVRSPFTGIVVGVTTAPLTTPGTGITHIAKLKKALALVERSLTRIRKRSKKKRRSRIRARGLGMLAAVTLAGTGLSSCGTLSTSVLRHQTGESIGQGKGKVSARIESARMVPAVPGTDPASATEQTNDVYQAASFGIQGEFGLLPKFDVSLATSYAKGGGGWRFGGKYELKRFGSLAVGTMIGYGSYFGAGSVTYLTSGTPESIDTTLAAQVFDLGLPVSLRFSPSVAVYSGLTIYRIGVRGAAGGDYVSSVNTDIGMNLGLRLTFGRIEGDLEYAMIDMNDPFANSSKMVPYLGLSFGFLF